LLGVGTTVRKVPTVSSFWLMETDGRVDATPSADAGESAVVCTWSI